MPDYNLGRATGEILITADTEGIRKAQAEMAATAAEAEALDASMGKVNKQFDENRRGSSLTAEQLVNQRGRLEELRLAHERYSQTYQDAAKKREEIDRKLQRARDDENVSGERLLRLGRDLQRAKDDEERTLLRMETAYEKYQTRLSVVRLEVERFNQAHLDAATGLRNFARGAEEAGRSVEQLGNKLSGIVRILGTTGIYGLFGGAAGGGLGLLGGSGLQGLTVGLGGVVEIVKDFAGAMLLVPGVVNAAVISLGTLKVGFHGIAEELANLDDPQKFVEGLRELAPAAQQAMIQIQTFTYAFRGARQEVQESLFAPILADIQPLVQTWLPQLMNAGQQIANQFGQAMHQVFGFFQQPEVVQGFQLFVNNLVQGFQAARNAIQPFLQAWNTLATVGSSVFERLGRAITTIAIEFNNWVQRASQSGEILRLINAALDGFTALGNIIADVAVGIANIFDVASKTGGSFLITIEKIAEEFRAWTESAKGQTSLTSFFTLLKESADAARPIIHDLGSGIATIASTLAHLGVAIGPGLKTFFDDLAKALKELEPAIIAMAPAINEFLTAFGGALVQIVEQLGPQLPNVFKSLADSLVELGKILPVVVPLLAGLLEHITPHEIELVISLATAFKLVGTAMAAVDFVKMISNPIGLVVVAIALLIVGIGELITHWDTVKQKVGEVTEKFGGLSGVIKGLKEDWDAFTGTISRWIDDVVNAFSGGWDKLTSALGGLKDKIVGYWNNINWTQLGKDIVQGMVDGILDAAGLSSLKNAVHTAMGVTKDATPGSRAKTGPWSTISPEEAGTKLVTDYAAGMSAGTPAVADASSGVAASTSGGLSGGAGTGTGGGGTSGGSGSFTTAGQIGISGKGLAGGSGFDQWVSFITQDMSAWSQIFHGAFDLFQSISSSIVQGIKIVASIWNGGQNPLTQQGGVAGPQALANQQPIPGAQYAPLYGKAPFDWGPLLFGAQQPKAQVPGVPNVAPGRTIIGPPVLGADGKPVTPPAPAAPAAPAASAAGRANLTQDAAGNYHANDPWWEGVIQAESGGRVNPPENPTHFGMFQFSQSTWDGIARQVNPAWVGKNPGTAPADVQSQMAQQLYNQNKGNLPSQWANPYVNAHPGGTAGSIWSPAAPAPAAPAPTPAAPAPTPAAPAPTPAAPAAQAAAPATNVITDPSGEKFRLPTGMTEPRSPGGYVGNVIGPNGEPRFWRKGADGVFDLFDAQNNPITKPEAQATVGPGTGGKGLQLTPASDADKAAVAAAAAPPPAPAAPAPTPAAPAGAPPPDPKTAMQGINLSTIPIAVQQYADDCIDASAQIILSHSGINLSQDQLENTIPPGTNIDVQAAGLNKLLPQGQFRAMQGSGGSQQAMFNAIKASIDKGVGSILNVAPGSSLAGRTFAPGHFIAATGYNPDGTINVSDTAGGKQYSVTAEDAYQATQGRGIVAGTGTGPPPIGANVPPANPPASTTGDANADNAVSPPPATTGDGGHPGAGTAVAIGGGIAAAGFLGRRAYNRGVYSADAEALDFQKLMGVRNQDALDAVYGPQSAEEIASGRTSLRARFPNLGIVRGGPPGAGPTTAGESLYGGGIDVARIQEARAQLQRPGATLGAAGRTPGERLGYWGQGEPPAAVGTCSD